MTVREFLRDRNLTEDRINIWTGYGDGGDGNLPLDLCLDDIIIKVWKDTENYVEIEI